MAVCSLDVIHLEGKSISFVDDQSEVFVDDVLSSDLLTTGIRSDGDFRLFDNLYRVTKSRDFTKIKYVIKGS
jgi:hypothetical protein